MNEDSKDCLECRLISGGGLLGASIYVVYNSRNLKPFSRRAVSTLGYGFGVIGLLRLFGLYPFRKESKEEKY